jgi:hypothetical protein
MRKQDYLLHLIHSLSPSEKRYFKVFCQSQSGGKQYLKLFTALEKSTSYDAVALAKSLGIKPGNLAHEKDYLQDVLLRNLRMFHEEFFIDTKLMSEFLEADLLYRKGMYEYCINKAEKTLDKALKYERFGLAQNFTRLLSYCYNQINEFDKVQEMNRKEMQLLEATTEYVSMIHLRDRFMPVVTARKNFESLKDIGENELFKKEPQKLKSWLAMHCQSEIGLFYYQYVKPDPKKALAAAQNQLALFKKAPHFKVIIPTAYYSAFSKISVRHYGAGNYREALQYVNQLIDETQQPVAGIPTAIMQRYNIYGKGTKMTLLSLLHQFTEASAFGHQVYESSENMNKGDKLTFLFDYALSLFHTGDYDGCHKQLNLLMDDKTKERVDVQLFARILFVMLQLQLKNYSLIPYQVKNLRVWQKRTKADSPGVAKLLQWLDKLGKAGAINQLSSAITAFKHDLVNEELKPITKELALDKWKLCK